MLKDAKTEKELQAIFDEILLQTDRGAAIISASILEEHLTDVLRKRLILTSRLSERLFNFDKNGPLSDFAQKIDIGFAVGIISSELRDDLHNIRRVRNAFAHHVEPLNFAHESISGFCSALRGDSKNPKFKFLHSVTGITMLLMALKEMEIKIKPMKDDASFDAEFNKVIEGLLPDT